MRYTSNLIFALSVVAFIFALWLGQGRLSSDWVRLLCGGTLIGFGLHLYGNCGRKSLKRANVSPELLHQAYLVGYWTMVVAVLAAIAVTRFELLRADTALPLLAVVLIVPNIFIGWVVFYSRWIRRDRAVQDALT